MGGHVGFGDRPVRQGRIDLRLQRANDSARTVGLVVMARLRLFAGAREAAGIGSDSVDGATVADVLAAADKPGDADHDSG